MKVTYSINQYDEAGDMFDKCILININDTTILHFKDIDELANFFRQLDKCIREMIKYSSTNNLV